ncbi:MAG: molybdopterin-dependent oxidoreductase [Rhodobacterales bacterium]|nr:molybdopterin-dependent oxidoreductase [Rhodobacterales bacterium]
MTNSIPEIRDTELMFVIGSNTTEAHPIIAMEMKKAVHRGAKLIVADPRGIWLSDVADLHLQLKPGTDVALLNGMLHVILHEGLYDADFVAKHTEGLEALMASTVDTTPEWAEEITSVPADSIRQAARMYATTKKAGIYYTLGITEHTHGTDNVYGLANLVAITGHLGVKSAGLNPLRGQNNVQGANDAGASPIYYPGYQRVDNPEAQARFEAGWGVPLSPDPGLDLNIMMKQMGKSIRGLYVMGEDIVLSEPNANRVEEGMNALDFVVVQDIFLNETCRFADVILPAACFAEKDGVFTNSDRRVQRVRKAVNAPGEARADWEIICDISRACGYPMPWYNDPGEVYAEMAALTDQFAGITHERIAAEGGLQWPCTSPDHPGTPTLHEGAPIIGKIGLQPTTYRSSAELPDELYPLLLSTGRTLYHYNSATQTRRAEGANELQPVNFIMMHRRDAKMRGLRHGDAATVRSRRGEIVAKVDVSAKMKSGCVWMPLHFAEANTNRLTNDAGDTTTNTAEYKVCAVTVEAVQSS